MVNAGLRRGEVSHLDTTDLFNRGKVCGIMVQRKGHSLKDVHKLLSPDIYQALIELAGENINVPNYPLFTTCTPGMEKRRLSAFQISAVIKKHLIRIGLSDKLYSAHSLRHTTGTVMAMQGKDIYTICEYLGHASVATSQYYIQMAKELKSWNPEEANNLSNLFKLKDKTGGYTS
jgi:integrase/recombinase XerC/integrase/recombinase XerD